MIGSVKENLSLEKRISITPEIAKKYGWKYKTSLENAILATYGNFHSIMRNK